MFSTFSRYSLEDFCRSSLGSDIFNLNQRCVGEVRNPASPAANCSLAHGPVPSYIRSCRGDPFERVTVKSPLLGRT